MNINKPSPEFDRWLRNWMFEVHDGVLWFPTTNDFQARAVLEKFIERNPEWWVDLVYDASSDFPWHVWLRPQEGFNPEYTPSASGYPLPLMMCQVVILALTNGEIWYD